MARLVSLSSSLPAACVEPAKLLVPAPRVYEIVTVFRQDVAFTVGHRIADFWQGLTRELRLAFGGGRGQNSSNSNSFHRSLWDCVRERSVYHFLLTGTSFALHSDFANQRIQEVARITSREPKQHDTIAFRSLWRNKTKED